MIRVVLGIECPQWTGIKGHIQSIASTCRVAAHTEVLDNIDTEVEVVGDANGVRDFTECLTQLLSFTEAGVTLKEHGEL